MPGSEDYRKYLEEKFEGFSKLMNAQFINVHDKLDTQDKKLDVQDRKLDAQDEVLKSIKTQVIKTNGTVQEHEKFKTYAKDIIDRRPIDCPNLDKMNDSSTRIGQLEKKLEDVMFFVKHPKLFVGIIVFLVLVSIATFITRNPLRAFGLPKVQTEQVSSK
jgi:hypothetical protein